MSGVAVEDLKAESDSDHVCPATSHLFYVGGDCIGATLEAAIPALLANSKISDWLNKIRIGFDAVRNSRTAWCRFSGFIRN